MPLIGMKAAPVASGAISPDLLDFGDVTVGANSGAQSITLWNTGNAAMTISGTSSLGAPFVVSSNSCGSTVPAGQSCVVQVEYLPTTPVPASTTFSITTNVGVQSVAIQGQGVVGIPAASPTSLNFGSIVAGTTSAAQVVTVSNSGNGPFSISGTPTTAAPFSVASSTCSGQVEAGESCSLQITFSPTTGNASSSTLSIPTSLGTQVVSLSGTGLRGVAGVSPASLTFTGVNVSTTSAPQTISVSNSGNAPITLSGVSGVVAPFAIAGNTCGSSLAAGASCALQVTFSPTNDNPASGTLSLNTSVGAQVVSLSGTGLQATATTSTSGLSFGSVNVGASSSAQAVTLTNTGNTDLGISSVSATGQYSTSSTCPSTLAAGANCTANVTFVPTTMGAQSGTLTFNTNAGNQTVSLSGTGLQTSASPSTSALAFGSVNVGSSSTAQSVTLTNTGNTTLSISSVTATGQYTTSTTCSSTLAAGGTCTANVIFAPATMGSQPGTLTFATSAGDQTVALSGTGLQAADAANVGSLSFGSVTVGSSSAAQAVTLTNTGNTAVSISAVTGSGPYAVTTNCASSLEAGGSCSTNVVFSPTTMGAQSGTLTFATSAGNQVVSLSGTGLETLVSTSVASLAFGNVKLGASSTSQTVTLSNTGNTEVSVSSVVTAGAYSETNTCPSSLAAGENCTATVVYTPTAMGSQAGTLTFSTSAGNETISLSGAGLQTSDTTNVGTLAFGSIAVGSSSSAQGVTLSNTGNTTITVTSVTGSGEYSVSTNCGSSLAAGASCSANVIFSPTSMGPQSGVLTFNTSAGNEAVSLSGTGLQTSASLNTTLLAFGGVNVGSSSSAQSVTLSNTGNTTLSISSVTGSGPYVFSSTCGSTLSAGGTCTASVTFVPGTMGAQTGTVTFATSAGNEVVSLSGTGLQTSDTANVGSLAFGSVNVGSSSSAQAVSLSNTGNTTVNITSVTVSGEYAVSTNCSTSLSAGGNCVANVTFTPTTMGAQAGTLTFNTSAGTQVVSLSGTGLQTSESLSASALNFGNVAEGISSSAQTVQLTNTGNTTISIGSITPTTGYSDSTTCSSSLAGGASCTVSVIFTPTVMAAQPGTLTIATSAGNQVVSLSGTGVEGVPQVSPGSLTYATTMVGSSSASQTVTLSNTGNWAFTLTASPAVSGPFSITSNNCSGSVGAGASCSIAVSYVPTASGTQTGALSIPTSSGTQTVSLSGTGQSPAHLVINGQSDFNFGYVSYASGATTITNTGGASATLTTTYSATSNEVSGTVTGTNAFSASPNNLFGTSSDLSIPPFAATGCATGTVLAAGQSCTLTVYGQEENGQNMDQEFDGAVSISIPGQTVTVTTEEMFAD